MDTDNDVYVGQPAAGQNAVFLFKNQHVNNTSGITMTWKGRTSLAPSSSTVYLQIYNRISNLWENIDSNGVSAANVKFTLTGGVSVDFSNYYDGSYWVAGRVYQEMT